MILYSKKVTGKGDRYYVSVLVEIPDVKIANNSNGGIGIDLGLKDWRLFPMVKLIKISISQQELKNWKRNCVENKDVSHENMRI